MPYADPEVRRKKQKEKYQANREVINRQIMESFKKRMEDHDFAEKHRAQVRERYHRTKHDPVFIATRKKHATTTKLRQKGLTVEKYWEIFHRQKGRCAICGIRPEKGINNSERALAVDHHHSKKEFRGLLCGKCNVLLGMCDENTSTLSNAILYLKGEGTVWMMLG